MAEDGSSPHTRGALTFSRSILNPTGIIPAYAGSTDHVLVAVIELLGSSPHTRGALV